MVWKHSLGKVLRNYFCKFLFVLCNFFFILRNFFAFCNFWVFLKVDDMLMLTTTATTVSYSQALQGSSSQEQNDCLESVGFFCFFFLLMTPDRLPWTLLSTPDVLNCAISSWCFMAFFYTQNSRTHSNGFRDRVHQKVFCIKSTGLIFNLCWNIQYLSLYKVSALGSWEYPHICLGGYSDVWWWGTFLLFGFFWG